MGLTDLYKQLLNDHPDSKSSQLTAKYQDARLTQALGEVLPKIELTGSAFYGNQTLKNRSGFDRIDHQEAIGLNATLFDGAKALLYFDLKKVLPKLAKNQVHAYRLNSYVDLSKVYFETLKARNLVGKLNKQLKSIQERAQTIRSRSKIGRSKKTDYLSARSQTFRIHSELELAKESLELGLLRLTEMTGVKINSRDLKVDLSKASQTPDAPSTLNSIPSIKVNYDLIEESKLNVKALEADWWPTLELNSNYYLSRRNFGRQDRWDVSLTLSWTLWDFGERSGAIEQQRVKLTQLELQTKSLERTWQYEYDQLRTQMISGQKRLSKLRQSYRYAADTYRQAQKEHDLGLVDHVALLRFLDDVIAAETVYDALKYDLVNYWHVLEAISGRVPEVEYGSL